MIDVLIIAVALLGITAIALLWLQVQTQRKLQGQIVALFELTGQMNQALSSIVRNSEIGLEEQIATAEAVKDLTRSLEQSVNF